MADLTRPMRDMLGILAFREGMGTCYLASGARARHVLVVPEMGPSKSLARLRAYNWRPTIRDLYTDGLITLGPWADIAYLGRQRLDSTHARSIALTDTGRAALGQQSPDQEKHDG